MKKWTAYSGYTALRPAPGASGAKLCDIYPNTIIESTGETQEVNGVIFERVTAYNSGKNFDGWVERAKIESYHENFPRDCVDVKAIQTPDIRDAEQYVLWKATKQVNMCGELSVCYLLKISLAQLLEKWEVTAPSFWKSVFGQGRARGTGESDMIQMLNLFDTKAVTLHDRYKSYTPGLISNLVGAIVAVKISTATGRLNGSGVGHWVVVTEVLNERVGYGLVYVYNPFPNRIEVYSYAEFLASARMPYGVIKAA
jgi:hypothetical protein